MMEKLRPICKFHAPIFFRALVAYWTLWYTSFMSLLYSIPLHFRGLIIICERKERREDIAGMEDVALFAANAT